MTIERLSPKMWCEDYPELATITVGITERVMK